MGYVIVCIVSILVGWALGCMAQKKRSEKVYANSGKNVEILNQWLIWKMSGVELSDVLRNKGVSNVAIYGMGMLGRHLLRELDGSSIKVLYVIDGAKKKNYLGVPVIRLSKDMPHTDMIINTVLGDTDNIERNIKKYYDGSIILLEDLVFDDSITITEEKDAH